MIKCKYDAMYKLMISGNPLFKPFVFYLWKQNSNWGVSIVTTSIHFIKCPVQSIYQNHTETFKWLRFGIFGLMIMFSYKTVIYQNLA